MKHDQKHWLLRVWGDYGCCTNPAYMAERISYPVFSQSACRGILENIFWKPEMRWTVHGVHILSDVVWDNIYQNELKDFGAAKPGSGPVYVEERRTQRMTTRLKNVDFVIEASVSLSEKGVKDGQVVGKYNQIFQRRASVGACFKRPYFGQREYAVDFRLVDEVPPTADINLKVQSMFYGFDYANRQTPHFYDAEVRNGVLQYPTWDEIRTLGQIGRAAA